jgi:transaldolase
MKFFIDTADVNEIRQAQDMGLLDGVTTNPSLIAKTGRKFEDVIVEICEIVDGPISAEVVSTDYQGMIKEAKALSEIHKNIIVKIPLITEGLKATRWCTDNGIGTNVTLCFSPVQAMMAAKAGASFISPFVGRLDDISHDGMDLIGQIVQIYDNYGFDTEVLVASVRHPMHVTTAALMGAHVATIPFSVLGKLAHHPLTQIGLEKFLADWEKVPS